MHSTRDPRADLSTSELAAALHVGSHTVRHWANAHIITPVRTSERGAHRWCLDDVRRQLEAAPEWWNHTPRPEFVEIVADDTGQVIHSSDVTRWPEHLIRGLIRSIERQLDGGHVVRRRVDSPATIRSRGTGDGGSA
jgi:hypothetical protein